MRGFASQNHIADWEEPMSTQLLKKNFVEPSGPSVQSQIRGTVSDKIRVTVRA